MAFLKQVTKMAVGYIGGIILVVSGVTAMILESTGAGALLLSLGVILILFGVYSERRMSGRGQPR